MGIFMIGSTLRLEGHLTERDCPFLKVVMKEAIHFGSRGITIEMAKLRSADGEVLKILAAGCFLLRLVGQGARFGRLPPWLPAEFKATVTTWGNERHSLAS